MVFCAWQAFKRRSLGAGAHRARLRVPVAALGAHRPGRVPVPLLHERCRSCSSPSPTSWPSCGTARRADVAPGAAGRRGVASSGPFLLWLCHRPAVRDRAGGRRSTRARRPASAIPAIPEVTLAPRAGRDRGRRSASASLLAAAAELAAVSATAEDRAPGGDRAARAGCCRRPRRDRRHGASLSRSSGPVADARGDHARGPRIPVEPIACVVLGIAAARRSPRSSRRRATRGASWPARSSRSALLVPDLYPNISALPLPSAIVNAYQGLLPTYLYPFQFPVNTDPAAPAPPLFARIRHSC